uniref:Uncharacterized protein n=1 Tax=Arundo donax TaxID=35708 RepID=A0A0A9DCE9_ARUDO
MHDHFFTNAPSLFHGFLLAEIFHIYLLMTAEGQGTNGRFLSWTERRPGSPENSRLDSKDLRFPIGYSHLLSLSFQLWSSILLIRKVILPYLP